MDYETYLRTENNSNLKISNLKFRNPLKSSNNQTTKNFKPIFNHNELKNKDINSKSAKLPEQSMENVELEQDISMLSVNDGSQTCRYFLPSGADFEHEQVRRQFGVDAEARGDVNRSLTLPLLNQFKLELLRLCNDVVTGPILIADIIHYQQMLECRVQPLGARFLEGSRVSARRRAAMFQALLAKCRELDLERYSAVLGMSLSDRYVKLKGNRLDVRNYRAIVVTCWFIACKFDLSVYPSISDIVHWSGVESWRDIGELEYEILNVTQFCLGIPTPIAFLRSLTIIKNRPEISHNIAKCFVEIAVCNYNFAGHPAHIIASAAYCLSICLSFRESQLESVWLPIMQYLFGLDVEDIRPVIVSLARFLRDTDDFQVEYPEIYTTYKPILDVVAMRREHLTDIINNVHVQNAENQQP